LNFAVT